MMPYVYEQAATAHLMSLREKRSNADDPLVSLFKVPTPFKVATKIVEIQTINLADDDGETIKLLWIMLAEWEDAYSTKTTTSTKVLLLFETFKLNSTKPYF